MENTFEYLFNLGLTEYTRSFEMSKPIYLYFCYESYFRLIFAITVILNYKEICDDLQLFADEPIVEMVNVTLNNKNHSV